MHKVLKSYLKRLTNLTGNNRSLLLLRLLSDQYIDLHSFNFLSGKPSFSILEGLIERRKEIPLCDMVDSRDEDSNVMGRKLKKLQRTEKFLFDERGAKDLHVGWPFIRGKFSDGSMVRCPLLFFPVELVLKNNTWILKLKKDVSLTLNKSFLLAYAYYNKVNIGDDLLERVFDDFDTDGTVFRTSLYQLLKESPLELNFNQENFKDNLKSFEGYKKAAFDEIHKVGELKLHPEAVLGIFPQSGSHLVPDYLNLIENTHINDIEEFFAHRTLLDANGLEDFRANNFTFLNKVEEERTFTPFKMDAFQENAIKAVKKGNSLVVQGPPGTGKSQLICNLISDFMARGKKVLLVCQKRAALDVVYNRLEEKGLADFLGLVHDFKSDRKSIYEKVTRQIDRVHEYKQKNNGLDSVQIERSFLQASRKIDQLTEEMEEFKFALFDESEAGVSVKELYLTSDLHGETINIRQYYRFFKLDEIHNFVSRLESYIQYAVKYDSPDHILFNRKSFAGLGLSEMKAMRDILSEIPAYQEEVTEKAKKNVNYPLNLEECEAIYGKWEQVQEMLGLLQDDEVYGYFQHMAGYADKDTDLLWLANTERVLMECYKGEGPEVTLKAEELGRFQEVLQRCIESKQGLLKLLKWNLSKDRHLVNKVLASNGVKNNRKGLALLERRVDNRLNLEHNLTKVRKQPWLVNLPESYDKGRMQTWFHIQRLSLKAKLIFGAVRGFKDFFNVPKLSYGELKQTLEVMHENIKDISHKKKEWGIYLSATQISNIIHEPLRAEKISKALSKDFDEVCELDNLKGELQPHEVAVIEKLSENNPDGNVEGMMKVFDNSLRLSWIEHIETKYPILRAVSSMKFKKMEAELQQAVREKMMVSNDILLLKAREETYESVEYNRLNNMVTYRDLRHQVAKQRRIWPLRRLIAEYYAELFQLTPCWMASPESVSAIFPMEEIFDLVIFDEASQCFSEKGIPAMYRGKQIVVTGDNKQLRPNDLYKVRFEDEDEENPTIEVDSLLEMASQYLMGVQLRGHYRSKSLDLIDFSNKHFYNGKLKLLPDYKDINAKEPAIKYIKVEGVWENNVNTIEAEEVVKLVTAHIQANDNRDVGVVTFNARQQDLILDLLEKASIEKKFQVPSTLFVKNIENVQGDERDIIIFSTAYAKGKGGKMMMQFGSLNAVNGENRLNVAVTRAREKIIIVSSILPQELKVQESKNEGPKLLKEYLLYAYNVSGGDHQPEIYNHFNKNANWFLKDKLAQWGSMRLPGYTFDQELPFADLTVHQNDRYLGLLITDDDIYFQSVSVKEAHVYTPFTMSKKNWKFTGLFSREYWHDRGQVEELILRFVNHNKIES